jgi:glycosyltransferase involved in cell wall biosynthesis
MHASAEAAATLVCVAAVNLVASVIARNEAGRYLAPCLRSLLAFCDEVRFLDDGSDDGTADLAESLGATVKRSPASVFFRHEGRARNDLLAWTLEARPSHVLAVDADEFVTSGAQVRAACEADQGLGSWALTMEEVWKADARHLYTREDGGWAQHPVGVLWRVPPKNRRLRGPWEISPRALACGREPVAVRRLRPIRLRASVLHFGWTNEADRQRRYDRYVEHDGGKFHASAHLQSIMWPDRKIRVKRRNWPEGLNSEEILGLTRTAVVA